MHWLLSAGMADDGDNKVDRDDEVEGDGEVERCSGGGLVTGDVVRQSPIDT